MTYPCIHNFSIYLRSGLWFSISSKFSSRGLWIFEDRYREPCPCPAIYQHDIVNMKSLMLVQTVFCFLLFFSLQFFYATINGQNLIIDRLLKFFLAFVS